MPAARTVKQGLPWGVEHLGLHCFGNVRASVSVRVFVGTQVSQALGPSG
jgi:hypothetical protein